MAFLHHGEVVDLGFSDYVLPLRAKGGVRCGECARLGEPAPVFQSRHALWTQHLFEPLLTWLNSQLATAIGIEYVVFGHGSTAVKLLHAA